MTEGDDQDGQASFVLLYEEAPVQPSIPLYEGEVANNSTSYDAKIASDADGDYVTVWIERYIGTGTYHKIIAQNFEACGTKIGDPIEVFHNGTTSINSIDIDMNDAGHYVVAWGDNSGVYKKHMGGPNDTGAKLTLTSDPQYDDVSVAINAAGDFSVVTWEHDESNTVFVNSGVDNTTLEAVNDFANDSGEVSSPDIAITEGNDFVVVWSDISDLEVPGDYRSYYSIHSRKYVATSGGWESAPGILFDGETFSRDHYEPDISVNLFKWRLCRGLANILW